MKSEHQNSERAIKDTVKTNAKTVYGGRQGTAGKHFKIQRNTSHVR